MKQTLPNNDYGDMGYDNTNTTWKNHTVQSEYRPTPARFPLPS